MNFMRNRRYCLTLIAGFLVWVVQLAATGVIEDKGALLGELEKLLQGYDAANQSLTRYSYEGRIFMEQRSASPEKQFEPVWEEFRLVRIGEKQRYDKQHPTERNLNICAIDDGEKITNLGGYTIVRTFSRDPEQDRWGSLTSDYNRYISMIPAAGVRQVNQGLRELQEKINKGLYDRDGASFTIERDAGGLFVIHYEIGGDYHAFWIDPAKGFNLVKAHTRRDYKEKFHSDIWQEAEFAQNQDGAWYLKSGRVWGEENGVLFERRIVVEKALFGDQVQVPQEFFDPKTLDIPPDMYRVDYRFSPPLEVRSPVVDADELYDLTEASTAETFPGTTLQAGLSPKSDLIEEKQARSVRHRRPMEIAALASGTILLFALFMVRRKKGQRRR